MRIYLEPWRKFADFTGRATRTEYWVFVVFNLLAFLGLAMLDNALTQPGPGPVGIAAIVLLAAAIVPSLAVLTRRLHDSGKSGAWALIVLIPGIGGLLLFGLTLVIGDRGPNRWGPDPRGHEVGVVA